MNAYDTAAWGDFANTVGGGAAALAGLLFVGLSMNLADVLAFPALPARAAATLGLLVAILVTAIFVASPGQDHRVLPRRRSLGGRRFFPFVVGGPAGLFPGERDRRAQESRRQSEGLALAFSGRRPDLCRFVYALHR